MPDDYTLKPTKDGGFFGILISETVVVLCILLTLLVIKYFFSRTLAPIKEWYYSDICAETDINEVLEEEKP